MPSWETFGSKKFENEKMKEALQNYEFYTRLLHNNMNEHSNLLSYTTKIFHFISPQRKDVMISLIKRHILFSGYP